MIVSRRRRYIFVHSPKTGGTALALALEARAAADDILIGDTPKAVKRRARQRDLQAAGRLWKHSRLADIAGLVTETEMAGFFVLTLVRNPWDRMVSYYHWLRAQGFSHPAVALARELPFAGFIRHEHTRASIAAAPYDSYVTDPAGGERCDLFARLESIDTDLAPFERHLGFRLTPLPRANPSDRAPDYRQYYTPEDADVVAETCAHDIRRFDYRF